MKLSALFSSHAVLQREKPIAIFGKCTPLKVVKCTLGDNVYFCSSDVDGRFCVLFAPMPAGGPYTLTAETLDGQERDSSTDIMVGEVWIAGGQSNMEFNFGYTPNMREKYDLDLNPGSRTKEYDAFIQENTVPRQIRFIKLERQCSQRRERDVYGEWQTSEIEHSGRLSAAGGWFALSLAKRFPGVAIGIIDNSWGGTCAEAWSNEASFWNNPDLVEERRNMEESRSNVLQWKGLNCQDHVPNIEKNLIENMGAVPDPGIAPFAQNWMSPDLDDSDWQDFKVPGSWIARKISGNGAVWFRQEFELPETIQEDSWMLNLGSIDKTDIAFVNGVEVGRTGSGFDIQYWAVFRHYPIPKGLLHPGRNVVAVRAYSHSFDGSLQGRLEAFNVDSPKNGKFMLGETWRLKVESNYGNFSPSKLFGPGNQHTPGILFDSLLRPIAPYGIRGVIWYQGENNANTLKLALQYETLIRNLIQDWRAVLENGNIPFVQVQLPLFRERKVFDPESAWAVLREAQERAVTALPDVGCVPILELGEADDIHPARKRLVGQRLANWALHHVYGFKEEICDGPRCIQVVRKDRSLDLVFDSELVIGEEGLDGFAVGADLNSAQVVKAQLTNDHTVTLTELPEQTDFIAYAWSDNPVPSLFNKQGWPAKPFAFR